MDDVQTRSTRPPMAPRHLKRRRLLPEIPEGKFQGNTPQEVRVSRQPRRQKPQAAELDFLQARDAIQRRKRRIALIILVLVTVSIPVLGLALLATS